MSDVHSCKRAAKTQEQLNKLIKLVSKIVETMPADQVPADIVYELAELEHDIDYELEWGHYGDDL